MTKEQLFEQVMREIQSGSIREWASSERNRPHVLKACAKMLDKGVPDPVNQMTILLVSIAIGL